MNVSLAFTYTSMLVYIVPHTRNQQRAKKSRNKSAGANFNFSSSLLLLLLLYFSLLHKYYFSLSLSVRMRPPPGLKEEGDDARSKNHKTPFSPRSWAIYFQEYISPKSRRCWPYVSSICSFLAQGLII